MFKNRIRQRTLFKKSANQIPRKIITIETEGQEKVERRQRQRNSYENRPTLITKTNSVVLEKQLSILEMKVNHKDECINQCLLDLEELQTFYEKQKETQKEKHAIEIERIQTMIQKQQRRNQKLSQKYSSLIEKQLVPKIQNLESSEKQKLCQKIQQQLMNRYSRSASKSKIIQEFTSTQPNQRNSQSILLDDPIFF